MEYGYDERYPAAIAGHGHYMLSCSYCAKPNLQLNSRTHLYLVVQMLGHVINAVWKPDIRGW